MANVNKVILIARLGNQPELRYTPSNHAVTELRCAVNHTWSDRSGQRQEKTDWFSVEVWDKQAENCEKYLSKGSQVYVEGRLSNDEWTDKDGQKRIKTKIIAERIQFLGARGEGEGGGRQPGPQGESRGPARGAAPGMSDASEPFPADDDIPF